MCFFFQAEDGIRDLTVTGVQTCALPISAPVFGVRQARAVGARRVGTNHLRFTLDDASGALPAIAFQWADAIPDHWLAERLDVAFRLERDEWQGRATLQARGAGEGAGGLQIRKPEVGKRNCLGSRVL